LSASPAESLPSSSVSGGHPAGRRRAPHLYGEATAGLSAFAISGVGPTVRRRVLSMVLPSVRPFLGLRVSARLPGM
jgi:hypothetical protein